MKQLTSDQWIRRAAVLIRLRRRMLISTRRH